MAYRQTTHCIAKAEFDSFWNVGGQTQNPAVSQIVSGALQAAKTAFIGALIGAGIGAALSGGSAAGFGALVGGAFGLSLGFVNGFCDQWLNRRLICLTPQDQCILGTIANIDPVASKPFFERLFDNDLSMNVRLLPYDATEFPWDKAGDYDWTRMQTDGFPAAALVTQQFLDLNYGGYGEEGNDRPPNHPGGRWSLHCEFEGNAMETLCAIARVLAVATLIPPVFVVLVVAGAIAGAIGGAVYAIANAGDTFKGCKKKCKIPIVCDVACAIVVAASVVAGIVVGAIVGALSGPGVTAVAVATVIAQPFVQNGDFSDAADNPESGTLHKEDCVFVAGDHVYDAGHPEGWHELHPVKHVQKMCQESFDPQCCPHADSTSVDPVTHVRSFDDPAFRDRVFQLWNRWCGEYHKANDPRTTDNQANPENLWCLHPLIDGCQRPTDPTNGGPVIH
jgi:hypothetical protein